MAGLHIRPSVRISYADAPDKEKRIATDVLQRGLDFPSLLDAQLDQGQKQSKIRAREP